MSVPLALKALAVLAAWEGAWWAKRRYDRGATYDRALARARATGKHFLVVGAPDAGVTAGYGCGDTTVDLFPSACAGALQHDVTTPLPFPDDSCVVFVACVLEYVDDLDAALAEIRRVGGDDVYLVRVEPWTLTAYLYPGAKRTLPGTLVRRTDRTTRRSLRHVSVVRSTDAAPSRTDSAERSEVIRNGGKVVWRR